MKTRSVLIACATCAALLAGCASAPAADPRDPLEPFNRQVNTFNRGLDQAVLKPVAKAYVRALPAVIRQGVSNFFSNVGDIWSAANSLLQIKPVDAAQNMMRFAVNTVFGLGGVLDIATDAGIDRHKQDFGSTLARWGVPQGPYLVLPVLGPSSVRGAAALPADWFGNPLTQVTPVAPVVAAFAVDARAQLLPLDKVLDEALDPYTFMREAYLQRHGAKVELAGSQGEDLSQGTGEDGPPAPEQRE